MKKLMTERRSFARRACNLILMTKGNTVRLWIVAHMVQAG